MATAKYAECAGNTACECEQLVAINEICSSTCGQASTPQHTQIMLQKCGPQVPGSVAAQSVDLRHYFQFFDAKTEENDSYDEEEDDDDSDCDNGDDSDDGSKWHVKEPSDESSDPTPVLPSHPVPTDTDATSNDEEEDEDDECPNGSWGEPGSGFDIHGNPIPLDYDNDSDIHAEVEAETEDAFEDAEAEDDYQLKVKRQLNPEQDEFDDENDDGCDDGQEEDDLWLNSVDNPQADHRQNMQEMQGNEDMSTATVQAAAIPKIRNVALSHLPNWMRRPGQEKKNTTAAAPPSDSPSGDSPAIEEPSETDASDELPSDESSPVVTSPIWGAPSSTSQEVVASPTQTADQRPIIPVYTPPPSSPDSDEAPSPHLCDENCGETHIEPTEAAPTPIATSTTSLPFSAGEPSASSSSSTPTPTPIAPEPLPLPDSELDHDELAGEPPVSDLDSILDGIDKEEMAHDSDTTPTGSLSAPLAGPTANGTTANGKVVPFSVRPVMVASKLSNPLDTVIASEDTNSDQSWEDTSSSEEDPDCITTSEPAPQPTGSRRSQVPGYKKKTEMKDSLMNRNGNNGNNGDCDSEQEECSGQNQGKMYSGIKERLHKNKGDSGSGSWDVSHANKWYKGSIPEEAEQVAPTVELEDIVEASAEEGEPISLQDRLVPDMPELPNLRGNMPSFRGTDEEEAEGDEPELDDDANQPASTINTPVATTTTASLSTPTAAFPVPSEDRNSTTNGTSSQFIRAASNAMKNSTVVSRNITLTSAQVASQASAVSGAIALVIASSILSILF